MKKIYAILITLILVVAILPICAFADEDVSAVPECQTFTVGFFTIDLDKFGGPRIDGNKIQNNMGSFTLTESSPGEGVLYTLPEPGFTFCEGNYTFLYYKIWGQQYQPGDTIMLATNSTNYTPVNACYSQEEHNGVPVTINQAYHVTLLSDENGMVFVSESTATAGTPITVSAFPFNGYELDTIAWRAEGDDYANNITLSRQFNMPEDNVTVEVSFKEHEHDWDKDNVTFVYFRETEGDGGKGRCKATLVCKEDPSHTETVYSNASMGYHNTFPTCTEGGEDVMDYSFPEPYKWLTPLAKVTTPVPANGHEWEADFTVDKTANCTEEGSKSIHCKNCDAVKDSAVIDPHGHKFGEWKENEAPDCTNGGGQERTCEICGITETQEIDPHGHKFSEWKEIKAANCTDHGGEERVCSVCSFVETRDIDPKGHKWESDYRIDKAETCTEEGSKSIHCRNCDAKKDSTVIDSHGHKFGEWKEITAPDCTNGGGQERTCEICGYTETQGIDPNGHDWETDYRTDKPENCTEEGSKSIHCKHCDAVKDSTVIDPHGHKFSEWEEIKAPNCTDHGGEERICSICGFTETRNIDANGHEWNTDFTIDKEPNCTEEGSKSIHCKHCDAVKDSTVIDPLGHDWSGWVVTKEATEAEEGMETRTCSRCEETETRAIPKLDPQKVTYRSTKGDGVTWMKGSTNALAFTFKRSVDDASTFRLFTGIKVDGNTVEEYEAESGSVIIRLNPAYLETLSVGRHTLTAEFEDGSAYADFTVLAAKDDSQKDDGQKDEEKKDDGQKDDGQKDDGQKDSEKKDNAQKDGDKKDSSKQPTAKKTDTTSAAAKTDTPPKTGDESNAALWMVLMIASLVTLVTASWVRRRKHR